MTVRTLTAADYEKRLNRLTTYVRDHLDEDIDLHALADVSGLSAYHWHRIYHARRGETMAATVNRLRLQRAAAYLTQSEMSIAEIAEGCGYRDSASFSRAFERAFGMPPARCRARGQQVHVRPLAAPLDGTPCPVDIESRPPMTAITVAHRGPYPEIGRAFDTLIGWLDARALLQPDMRSVAIFYDDPALVAPADLESRAGVLTSAAIDVEWPLERTVIAGCDYAVLRHVGPHAHLERAYAWLFGEWLPESGREPAHEPVFEEYVNDARDTPEQDLMTLVYLPLA
jgi:AraC family transcriptional regulator